MIERKNNTIEGKAGYSRGMFVDIHCHCLAAIDDGPATMKQSIELCDALVRDRVKIVIATPHQLGQYDKNNGAAKIREKVEMLNAELSREKTALTVKAGGDVRIDERICKMIEDDEVLTVADNKKYVLLEQPADILIDIEPLFKQLSSIGVKGIITHPERHLFLMSMPQILYKWKEKSVYFQITSGSLLGKFGPSAQKGAWQILSSGGFVVVASDSHNTSSRAPCMRAAYELIRARLGELAANISCVENPKRIMEGREALTIPVQEEKWGFNEQKRNRFRNYAKLLGQI